MTDEQTKRVFEFKHIYVKDVSFESPLAPEFFSENKSSTNLDVDVNLHSRSLNDEKTDYECVLLIRVTAKSEDEVIFLVELSQAGVVEIQGFSDADLAMLLNIAAPNTLLPFARESIASLVSKGGFPQLLLKPLNFERIYQQKLKADAEKEKGTHTEH